MGNHELRAESLLDKFGFCDGDQFIDEVEEYYSECEEQGVRPEKFMCSRTLCAVVKEYLIPSIPFDVDHIEVTTMHNPIRLTKLDGNEIEDYDLMRELLKGEKVNVGSDQVKEIIRRITSSVGIKNVLSS